MCDDTTESELDEYLERRALTRRHFTAGATAAIVAGSGALTACATPDASEASLLETDVSIPSPDGTIDAKFVVPADGAHAAVIFWPDIHGVRPAHFGDARRLAASGYAVLAANPYYRTHQGRLFAEGETIRSEGGWDKVQPHYSVFTPDTIATDSRAIVSWLDAQKQVDTNRGIGAVGFCMTGAWTIRAGAAIPERVKAPASFHSGRLVMDEDSPHLLIPQLTGGALIGIAENDHTKNPAAKDTLIKAFADAGVPAEVEVYEDAMHGWVPTDSRAYDPEQSERAWSRMLALFQRELS